MLLAIELEDSDQVLVLFLGYAIVLVGNLTVIGYYLGVGVSHGDAVASQVGHRYLAPRHPVFLEDEV